MEGELTSTERQKDAGDEKSARKATSIETKSSAPAVEAVKNGSIQVLKVTEEIGEKGQ